MRSDGALPSADSQDVRGPAGWETRTHATRRTAGKGLKGGEKARSGGPDIGGYLGVAGRRGEHSELLSCESPAGGGARPPTGFRAHAAGPASPQAQKGGLPVKKTTWADSSAVRRTWRDVATGHALEEAQVGPHPSCGPAGQGPKARHCHPAPMALHWLQTMVSESGE